MTNFIIYSILDLVVFCHLEAVVFFIFYLGALPSQVSLLWGICVPALVKFSKHEGFFNWLIFLRTRNVQVSLIMLRTFL